ncbi:MAG: 2Fe-2S iron-sulfur cluster binding domain-containing protein, partial [Anaerolineae bacterium]|nr:2Fe-2S iron-sulfur cluster binding domain-containing protein [Anaerolineae bacterium]
MIITIKINHIDHEFDISPNDTLLTVLRKEGYFGAKFGGCSKGECGACSILLDGKVTNACSIFAVQAEGHSVQTIESIGEHPTQGWRRSEGLSVLQ